MSSNTNEPTLGKSPTNVITVNADSCLPHKGKDINVKGDLFLYQIYTLCVVTDFKITTLL